MTTTKRPIRFSLPDVYAENAKNLDGDKERIDTIQLITFDASIPAPKNNRDRREYDPRFSTVVEVRCWMGRSKHSSTVYASVWIRTRDGGYLSGYGSAGGYGYCKRSAAIADALTSAGFDAKECHRIHGAGMSVVKVALHAIADASGYRRTPRMIAD